MLTAKSICCAQADCCFFVSPRGETAKILDQSSPHENVPSLNARGDDGFNRGNLT
jgi:hypothetical protein